MSLPYEQTSLAMFQFDGKDILPCYISILVDSSFYHLENGKGRYYLEAIREDDDAAAALVFP